MDILAHHQQQLLPQSLHHSHQQLSPQLQPLQSHLQVPQQLQQPQPPQVLPLPQQDQSQQAAQDQPSPQEQLPRRPTSAPKAHAAHPGCPDNLGCLADSDTKPRDTFATIIRCAILGTAAKRMTLNCIYNAIEDKYPYYRDAGPGWKNTVRHVLSTSQQFEKSRRPITEPGKGGYWSVSKTLPKSDNHRTRRMNRVVSRKEKEAVASEQSPQAQAQQAPSTQQLTQPPQPTTQTWAPQQISVPWLQYQDFSYMRSLPQPGSDQSSEVDSRYSPHLQPTSIVTAIPHYSEHQSYQVVAPISPMPHLPQYTHTHTNHLMYSYEKSPERPGWLTEVSWNNAPLGTVPTHVRQ